MHYASTDSGADDTSSVCASNYSMRPGFNSCLRGCDLQNTHTPTHPSLAVLQVCCPERVFLNISTLWRRTDRAQKVPCLSSPRLANLCFSLSLCWLCRLSCWADTACRAVQINSVTKHTHLCAHREHNWIKIHTQWCVDEWITYLSHT